MNENNLSVLAKLVLDTANNRCGKRGSTVPTVEDIYAAAITIGFVENVYASNAEKTGIDTDELKNMVSLIYENNSDPVAVLKNLTHFAEKDNTADYIKSLTYKKVLFRAESMAEDNNTCVTADSLLRCILEDPTRGVRYCVKEGLEIQSSPTEKPESVNTEPAKKAGKSAIKELIAKTKEIRNTLLEQIFGQDNAVDVFTTGCFQAELAALTDKNRYRPKATYLFAGPPGVGKTFLAEKAAEILGVPFMRFDMSEYSDDESVIEFCGSDKVYRNGKAGNVTRFVEENPKCVLLFDEIEKAHMNVINLFLQMLDAGRLRDNYTDNEIPFKDAVVIFTTNAGRKLYENTESGDFSGVSRKVILKALENDVNPVTGAKYFPAAMCSRFASGNVVMFNRIDAAHLREIAKKEILRHASDMEAEFEIKSEFDDRVFSALMFAQGGAADARTVKGRAAAFYDGELFELFRLMDSACEPDIIDNINSVSFKVELPEGNGEICALFESEEKPQALIFASSHITDKLGLCSSCGEVFTADNLQDAKKIIKKNDIKFVMCDVCCGKKSGGTSSLNIEDIDSEGRDFFRYVREKYFDLPVYLLETDAHSFTAEEKFSFSKEGARAVVALEGEKLFAHSVEDICCSIHAQQSMNKLARANKVVSFETAQSISADGKSAEIRLFDFELSVAVDPDDSQNILSNISKPEVRFEQVIGAAEAKEELEYFVKYLKNPKKFSSTGVRVPKGVLLYGPPGTGKTMLAKAMAGESDVTFITAEGNRFLRSHVGEGSKAVHDLFSMARRYAPSILFVDEIDAIAKSRKGSGVSEDVLTAFLVEMDGFRNDTAKPVFVLAATNFEVEQGRERSLDSALLRRFDRRIFIDLPDREARTAYLLQKTASNTVFEVSEKVVENIAMRSVGMSLARLDSVCELAIRSAIRSGSFRVDDAALEDAFETFNSGRGKKWDSAQLLRVARHEAGHTLMCVQSGEIPSYVTVVSGAKHGGYMQHSDGEGKLIYTKRELLAKIRTALGGRAAETVYYGDDDGASTGASGDIEAATRLATDMICRYGMNEEFGIAAIGSDSQLHGAAAEKVAAAVNKVLESQLEEAKRIIKENLGTVDAFVDALIGKNHLSYSEIEAFFTQNKL
ncbi:MAG: AAA family ATPase [Clostridia bacterium]|nr:AAA family ATPase [Clostridia bacterium]